jgi:hypothetical protein
MWTGGGIWEWPKHGRGTPTINTGLKAPLITLISYIGKKKLTRDENGDNRGD